MTGLEVLYLTNNQLTELPKEIGHMTGLEVLNLTNNQLTELPKEIQNLLKRL
jgi:Leucine-rich repeat (LRR) protein